MGFSVVSLVEIFYFLTLRPYCTSRKNRHRRNQLLDSNNSLNGSHDQFRRRGFNHTDNDDCIRHDSSARSSHIFQSKRTFNYNNGVLHAKIKRNNMNLKYYLNDNDEPKYIYCE